jgi:chemotaxis protein MotB
MNSIKLRNAGLFLFVLFIASSCVSSKKYNELRSKRDLIDKENSQLKDENRALQTSKNEHEALISRYSSQIDGLQQDTTRLGRQYRRMANNYNGLNKNYQDLLTQNQQLVSGTQTETKKILAQLQKSQADLIKREDSLNVLEKEYSKRKNELDKLSQELNEMKTNLAHKEAAYNELYNEVQKKDSLMIALKNSVSKALVGFENQGLTVSTRNGRVYVSMENKLMFASGSFEVNPKGKEALDKLASVLQDKPDIEILVEGHTDNVPFPSSGKLADNWDLSAKRATSIVRILLSNTKIQASRVTAAGRGEFSPIESNATPEGRAKNRRTEIILMPDLSKLYKIVNE